MEVGQVTQSYLGERSDNINFLPDETLRFPDLTDVWLAMLEANFGVGRRTPLEFRTYSLSQVLSIMNK